MCATPWASVSAKRTRIGIENVKPSIDGQYLDMSVARLAELIQERQPCVVLTGAGISTESGIPDFRSAEGIWAQYDPFEVAHIDALRRDPARVWEFYARRLEALSHAEPNDGHRALAELEERGLVRAVVTQNIDGLHQRAGSREVVEVHGSVREAECIHCGVRVPMADAVASLPLPPCPECGEILKPGVVMFGELLPAQAIERAQALAAEAGLLLVVGSSLEVHPVAALPGATLASGRRARDRQPRRHAVGLQRRTSCSTPARARLCAVWRPRSVWSDQTDRGGAMADGNKDLVARLADLSEGAIQRLSEAPGADRALQALKGLGDRVDELQRRTRGFEELEKRLTTLEKRVDSLAKPKPARKPASGAGAAPPKSGPPPKKP